jgi:hypothetical protein
MPDEVKCPKCSSTQLSANKKGFSGKKAVAGAVLTGGIGLLAGTIGSNKIIITCLNCGNQFKPGTVKSTPAPVGNPKIIWDEVNKEHRLNPNYKDDTVTMGCMPMLIIIVVIILVIVFIWSMS